MQKLAILGAGDAETPDATTPAPIVAAARNAHPELRMVPGAVFPDTPAARENGVRHQFSETVMGEFA